MKIETGTPLDGIIEDVLRSKRFCVNCANFGGGGALLCQREILDLVSGKMYRPGFVASVERRGQPPEHCGPGGIYFVQNPYVD